MKLKNFIQKSKKTFKEVGRELGFSETDVYRYCAGIIIPRPDRMKKITEWSNGEVQPNDWYKEE